jgi:hypothetical protein
MTTGEGPPWRRIRISAEDARGPTGKILAEEYQRQHGYPDNRKIYIYRRKEGDGGWKYIFSPSAGIEARGRLKGIGLTKIKTPDHDKLLNEGFSRTER